MVVVCLPIDLINIAIKRSDSFEEREKELNGLRAEYGSAFNGYRVIMFRPEENGSLADFDILECDGVHICSS